MFGKDKNKKWRDENRSFFFYNNIFRDEFVMLGRKESMEAVKEGQEITGSHDKERRTSLPSSL
jgi:hypothetical protein